MAGLDYGALAQGIGSAVQGVLGIGSVALNNNQQWRNWKRQHEYLLQDWYRQNAYNSPAQQMKRFERAGLNPNLIYGQQNTAGGIDTPPPPSVESPLSAIDVQGAVNAVLNRQIQLKQLAIQQQNSDALVKLYAAKADQASTSAALNNAMTALRTLQHEGYESTGYYKSQGILQQKKIDETMSKIKLLMSNTTIADLQGEFLKKTMQTRINALGLSNTNLFLRNIAQRQFNSLYSLRKGILQNEYQYGNIRNPYMTEKLNQLRESGDFLFDSYPLKLDYLRNQNSMFPYLKSHIGIQDMLMQRQADKMFIDAVLDYESALNPYKFLFNKRKW